MNLETLKEQLTCPVCFEELKHVRSLFCGHTLCMMCAFNCITTKNECPVCRWLITCSPALHLIEQNLQIIIDLIFNKADVEVIKQAISTQFKCQLCDQIAIQPIQTYCKHLFCKACISNCLLIEMRCPICKNSLPLFVDDIKEHVLIKEFILQLGGDIKIQSKPTNLNQTLFTSLPSIVIDSTLSIGFQKEIKIFEPRYLSMIETVMEGSRCFCLHSAGSNQYPHFADLVKIKKIKIASFSNRKIFELMIECIERIRIFRSYQFNNNNINLDEDTFKNYPECLWIVDGEIFHDEAGSLAQIIQDLKNISNIYEEFQDIVLNQSTKATFSQFFGKFDENLKQKLCSTQTVELNQEDLRMISKFSLKTIQFLKLNSKEKAYLYYSNDLEQRISLINKHLAFIKQMLQTK